MNTTSSTVPNNVIPFHPKPPHPEGDKDYSEPKDDIVKLSSTLFLSHKNNTLTINGGFWDEDLKSNYLGVELKFSRCVNDSGCAVLGNMLDYRSIIYLRRICVLPGYCLSKNFIRTYRFGLVGNFSIVETNPYSSKYLAPAILHSCLYDNHWSTRKTCDRIYREALLWNNVSRFNANVLYWMARIFGKKDWNKQTVENIQQEGHFLAVE